MSSWPTSTSSSTSPAGSATSTPSASGAELRKILQDNGLIHPGAEKPRKLIIFTEHRDTLDYLARKIRSLLGRPETVRAVHGGVRRADRRAITEEFTKNPTCQVLLARRGRGLHPAAAEGRGAA